MKLLLGLFLVSAAAARATHSSNGQNGQNWYNNQGYVNNNEYLNQRQGYSISDGQGRTFEYSQTKDTGRGIDINREDRKYTDNSINRNGADFTGASNFQIGNQRGSEQTGKNGHRGQQEIGAQSNNGQRADSTTGYRADYNAQRTGEISGQRTDSSNGHRTDVRVHSSSSQYTNEAINMQNANFQGASNFNIGHRGKREAEDTLARQKRGYYSADVYYSNDHRTDSSINMNGAQFQRANNFNIGHRGKRDVEVEEKENKLDQEVSRQKRGSYSANVHYTSDHRHDESINMNGAKFQGAHHFEIGHQRGKRDVETEQMNGEEQVVPREKRQYFNADVHLQNHYAHDESINMNGAQFQGANNFNIGHKRGKRDVETAEVQPSEQELSRQKRGYYNADVYYSNDHRTDKSINMERSQFTGAHHFNIGHKEKRSVGEEQTAEQELTRQKRGYFSADVSYSNQYKHDASINLNDAKFQGAHDFNIGHRSKRESEPEEKKDKTDKSETEKADKHLYREKRRMDWGSKGSVDMSYNLQGSNFQGAHHFEITRGRTRVFDV